MYHYMKILNSILTSNDTRTVVYKNRVITDVGKFPTSLAFSHFMLYYQSEEPKTLYHPVINGELYVVLCTLYCFL